MAVRPKPKVKTKTKIKTGDRVVVISGKEKSREGNVLVVDRKNNRVIVEGVNMVTKHQKARGQQQPAGIVKKEAPVHISNLMVVDSKGNATRIGRRIGEKGKLVRYSKKTGEEIK